MYSNITGGNDGVKCIESVGFSQPLQTNPEGRRLESLEGFDGKIGGLGVGLRDGGTAGRDKGTEAREPAILGVSHVLRVVAGGQMLLIQTLWYDDLVECLAKHILSKAGDGVFAVANVLGKTLEDVEDHLPVDQLLASVRRVPQRNEHFVHVHPLGCPASFGDFDPEEGDFVAEVERVRVSNIPRQSEDPSTQRVCLLLTVVFPSVSESKLQQRQAKVANGRLLVGVAGQGEAMLGSIELFLRLFQKLQCGLPGFISRARIVRGFQGQADLRQAMAVCMC